MYNNFPVEGVRLIDCGIEPIKSRSHRSTQMECALSTIHVSNFRRVVEGYAKSAGVSIITTTRVGNAQNKPEAIIKVTVTRYTVAGKLTKTTVNRPCDSVYRHRR